MNGFDDFRVGMAVDKGSPRLDEIDEHVSIDVRDVSTGGLFEINRISVNGIERTNGGVHATDQMGQRFMVQRIGLGTVHSLTSCNPLLLRRLSGVVGDNDAGPALLKAVKTSGPCVDENPRLRWRS